VAEDLSGNGAIQELPEAYEYEKNKLNLKVLLHKN